MGELDYAYKLSCYRQPVAETSRPSERSGNWTLLTGHGHVLVEIARNPGARMRDLSVRAGITERAVQLIVADLEQAGYITRHREGRRNRYVVNTATAFRHPSQDGLSVGPFLDLLATGEAASQQDSAAESRSSRRFARSRLTGQQKKADANPDGGGEAATARR
jgi:MarR family